MPTFSIIVPVYKTADYLSRCISSILNQTYADFELILIDDGSPDRCPAICDEYASHDTRIKVIHHNNGGVSSARNFGLNTAAGRYIWFIDSDDYIESFALEQLYMAQQKAEADIYFINSRGIEELSLGTLEEFFKKYYFTYVVGFGPWNKLYKKEIIQKYGLRFDTEETIGEDLLFNIAYYKVIYGTEELKKASFFIGKDYYIYDRREGSVMTTASQDRLKQQLRLFNKINNLLSGSISNDSMTYFFTLHLISGINQSRLGGLTAVHFSELLQQYDYNKYYSEFKNIEKEFFNNESASALGKIRVHVFIKLLQLGYYQNAGRLMGLR